MVKVKTGKKYIAKYLQMDVGGFTIGLWGLEPLLLVLQP